MHAAQMQTIYTYKEANCHNVHSDNTLSDAIFCHYIIINEYVRRKSLFLLAFLFLFLHHKERIR